MTSPIDDTTLLAHPLTLPCGAVIKNRLVKSAMSDSLADGKGNPTEAQARLYERWAEGEIGLSIIGEVQVDTRFPERPSNLVLDNHTNIAALQALTARAVVNSSHIWSQLGHAGGLAYSAISQPTGPSPLQVGAFHCAGMSEQEVSQLPDRYANAAIIAKNAGFTGVQIHAGHGFLLSQFLSPLFNRRQDQYGGNIASRSKIIIEIIDRVRSAVGDSFPIGIKVNTSDQLTGGLTQTDALEVIRILNQTTVDLIELSGGSYFPGAKSSSDSSSGGPYFVDFAAKARGLTRVPLLVTGGFKTRQQCMAALASDAVDLVGLARAFVLEPELARTWLNGVDENPEFPRFVSPPPGGVTAWYTMRLSAVAHDEEQRFNLDLIPAIQAYEGRDKSRVTKWLAKYP